MVVATDRQVPVFEDVQRAAARIGPYVHRTPVLTSAYFDARIGAELIFKCENFQKAGAFKARGAVNAVFGLPDDAAARGVATHSSGNHGQALAYAARKRGISAYVVMPENAPDAKQAAVRGYGGQIRFCEPSTAAREAMLADVVRETGANFVPPYNDARVIAGQGTCALELLEQAGAPLDTVIAPIGGGGLISGTCLTVAACAPETQVIAAEPEQADDAYRSFHAGRIVEDDAPNTVADGLRVGLRPLTWHFVSNRVADILLVAETDIVETMRLIWERMKIVIEPSCAVPVAALLRHADRFAGQRIGVILTGGNVDLRKLPWL